MTKRACPICKQQPPLAPYAPFCSKRCADIDLNRWFADVYVAPAADPSDEAEASVADQTEGA